MAISIEVAGTRLPEGLVSLSRGSELLWSEGTGRAAASGLMVGSVVAEKQTYTLTWGVIDQAAYNALIAAFPPGFFAFRVVNDGNVLADIMAYRSTVSGEHIGTHGGKSWWRGVSVDIVER